MQSPKPATTHWSVHPWKLAAILGICLPFGITIGLAFALVALMLQPISILLMLPALRDMLPIPDIGPTTVLLWMLPILSVVALAYALSVVFVLRTQAKHGLVGQAQNRISRASLPGLLLALALSMVDLLYPLTWDPSMTAMTRLPVLSMLMPAVYTTLLAAALLPVWRQQASLIVSALFFAAVSFAPALPGMLIRLVLGKGEPVLPWILVQPALSLTGTLVTAALFWAAGRRLWDALALQWGLSCLIEILAGLWNRAGGAVDAGGQNDIPHLVLWAVPGVVALVYLLVRDRRSPRALSPDPSPVTGRGEFR